MEFKKFIEIMTSNGCSNTVCNPSHHCFLPPKEVKLYDPNSHEKGNLTLDYSKILYYLDATDQIAIAYYGRYNLNNNSLYTSVKDKPTFYFNDFFEYIEVDSISFKVVGLYVRASARDMVLPPFIEDVFVDKLPQAQDAEEKLFGQKIFGDTIKFIIGNSDDSSFDSEGNTHFEYDYAYLGTLFTTGYRRLIHYFQGIEFEEFYKDDITLPDSLEIVDQGAMQGLRCNSLTFPKGVRRIEDCTLKQCAANTIIFKGELEYLGLDENVNTEFWINNSSDKVDIKGYKKAQDVLQGDKTVQRFRFAVPEPNSEPSENGLIKFSRWYRSRRYYDSYESNKVSLPVQHIASFQPCPLPKCFDDGHLGTLLLLTDEAPYGEYSDEKGCSTVLICESTEVVEKKIAEAKL